ncbi:MAG: DUF4153 domain-containing protein [Prolixibacteraceae bacterium]
MKDEILSNIENPATLEKLYRDNKAEFKRGFNLLYPEIKGSKLAGFWNERLNYDSSEISFGTSRELIIVIMASLLAGLIAKLPVILNIDPEFFYPRNVGFIVFPILSAYFILKNKLNQSRIIFTGIIFLLALVFINLLPEGKPNDTFILSCIHLLIFLWFIWGTSFLGTRINTSPERMSFLRFNGDLLVMMALILIAGGIMTGITIGLFSLIGFEIQKFYAEYIAVIGLAASPVVATFLIQKNPQLVGKVSPVIAKIFSPLVLITLVAYLIAILFSGKDPYNDRNFLIIFNGMLLGVMALIVFSVAEASKEEFNKYTGMILLALTGVTIVVNGIALSAIIFRSINMGITPNRLAVFGTDSLILVNLILILIQLFKTIKAKKDFTEVENSIAGFLPYYGLWAIAVTFIFPFIFGFK